MADDPKDAGSSGARPPDDYEARYMAGEGVLFRDKFRAPRTYLLLFLLPILIQAIAFAAIAFSGNPIPLPTLAIFPGTVLFMALLGLLFSVVRITVTRKEVVVQYGLFGPRIPVDQIQSCAAVDYDWKDYGGWGIRRGRDGSWAYNMMGDAGRAVRIGWTDASGKKQVTLLASRDPHALARSGNPARGVATPPAAPARLRLPADPRIEAEAEAEAEAVLREENERKEGRAGEGAP